MSLQAGVLEAEGKIIPTFQEVEAQVVIQSMASNPRGTFDEAEVSSASTLFGGG